MFDWLFPPSCPCDPSAREWLEERLDWLAEEFDDNAFSGRRIVLPTSRRNQTRLGQCPHPGGPGEPASGAPVFERDFGFDVPAAEAAAGEVARVTPSSPRRFSSRSSPQLDSRWPPRPGHVVRLRLADSSE